MLEDFIMENEKISTLKSKYNTIFDSIQTKINEVVDKYEIDEQSVKEWWYFTFIYFEKNCMIADKKNFQTELVDISNWFENEVNNIAHELNMDAKEVRKIYSIIDENIDKSIFEEFQKYTKCNIHNEENRKIKSLPNYNFGLKLHSFGHLGIKIENKKFEQCVFSNLKFKDCEIKDCSILQSLINEYSYLRKAKFLNVDFTGTIFSNCNLEKAIFKNCNLSYAKFENCILDIESILETSLPKESNLKLALVRQLYNNELQQGKTDSANKLLDLLMESEEENYKNILFNCEPYFHKLRKGKVFKYLFKYIKCVSNRHIWGNGIKIFRMTLTMFFIMIFFSCAYFFTVYKAEPITDRITNSIIQSCSSFFISNLPIGEDIKTYCKILVLIQNALGLVYFSFLTSALYRRIAR